MRLRDGDRLSSVALVAEQPRRRRGSCRREPTEPRSRTSRRVDEDDARSAGRGIARARRPRGRRTGQLGTSPGPELEAREHRHAREGLDVPVERARRRRRGSRVQPRVPRDRAERPRVDRARSRAGRPRARPSRRASSSWCSGAARSWYGQRARPGRVHPDAVLLGDRTGRAAVGGELGADRAPGPEPREPSATSGGRTRSRSAASGCDRATRPTRAVVDRARAGAAPRRGVRAGAARPGLADALDLVPARARERGGVRRARAPRPRCTPSGGSSAGYRFGTTRTAQPPPAPGSVSVSGGVRSSCPAQNGHSAGSGARPVARGGNAPGRSARPGATTTRSPETGSSLRSPTARGRPSVARARAGPRGGPASAGSGGGTIRRRRRSAARPPRTGRSRSIGSGKIVVDVLFVPRDLEQRLQVPQLQGRRVARMHLGGLRQLLGRLELALGADDLGAPLALGLGLARHRALHAVGSSTSLTSTTVTLTPHGSVCWSMIPCRISLIRRARRAARRACAGRAPSAGSSGRSGSCRRGSSRSRRPPRAGRRRGSRRPP